MSEPVRKRHVPHTLGALAALAALSGCNLAPHYERPQTQVPAAFTAPPQANGTAQASSIGWDAFFGDPQLQAYLRSALTNNADLAVAAARIEQARAQFRIQEAQRLPEISGQAGAARGRGVQPGIGADPVTTNQYTVQAGVSAFELDLWGRVRNLSEAGRRQYLATVEGREAFRLTLIGNVASVYYAIRSGEEGIALAQRTVASRRQGLDIARLRLDAGVTSSIDHDQAAVLLTQAQTELAELRRTTEQQRNQLRVLIGGPDPEALPQPRPINDAGQFAALDPGLPSALLEARPDIRQAEQQLLAANANIGAARAAFFPAISLTGAFGFVSTQLSSLFGASANNWSVGAGAALPIFDWGRRKAQLRLSEAQRDELIANYRKAVQTGFREVSDGLVGRQRYREQIEAQEQAVAAQRRLAETATLRYDNGIAIYLEVLDAQRNLFAAEQSLLRLRAAELQNGVSLYVALGGGGEA